MAGNPFDQFDAAQSGARVIATVPAKPPEGYHRLSPTELAPDTGGNADPRQAAALAAAQARARTAATTPIEVSGQIAAARAKGAIDLANEVAKSRIAPQITGNDVSQAKNKIAALMALNNQLRRSANQFDANFNGSRGDPNGGAFGRLAEYAPAFANGTNDAYDATIEGMAPLARTAFRSPGQGSDSDRDVNLFMGMMPNRFNTDQGNKQRYSQMSQMIVDTINGQRAILGMGPMQPAGKGQPHPQHPAASDGWSIQRVK